jgi:HJR/Mrr/RecB family endonuclease
LRRKRGLATDTLMGYGQLAEEELDIRDILPPDLVIQDRQIRSDRLSAIDSEFFEKLVAKLWRLQGYDQVKKTPRSGDGGIDVVAIRGMEGALIQCKSSAKEGNGLPWDAIKDVVTGANMYRRRHPGVQFKLVCITNQMFNAGAREQAEANNVELVERDGLAHLLRRYPVTELDINS